MEGSDEAAKYLTGLPWDTFENVLSTLTPHLQNACNKLPPESQVLMVCVRLQLNLPFQYLSMQTGLSLSTMHYIFKKLIDLAYNKLKILIHWSEKDFVFETIPPVFKANFPRLTSIIDCFEIFIEWPKNLISLPIERAPPLRNFQHANLLIKLFC